MKTSGNLSFVVNSLAALQFISVEPGLCPPAKRCCKPMPPLREKRAASPWRDCLDLLLWRQRELQSLDASKHGCVQAQAALAPADFCIKGGCCSVGIGIRCF